MKRWLLTILWEKQRAIFSVGLLFIAIYRSPALPLSKLSGATLVHDEKVWFCLLMSSILLLFPHYFFFLNYKVLNRDAVSCTSTQLKKKKLQVIFEILWMPSPSHPLYSLIIGNNYLEFWAYPSFLSSFVAYLSLNNILILHAFETLCKWKV